MRRHLQRVASVFVPSRRKCWRICNAGTKKIPMLHDISTPIVWCGTQQGDWEILAAARKPDQPRPGADERAGRMLSSGRSVLRSGMSLMSRVRTVREEGGIGPWLTTSNSAPLMNYRHQSSRLEAVSRF